MRLRPGDDEVGELAGVGLHREIGLRVHPIGEAAEAGAGRVEEDQISHIEHGVGIVDDLEAGRIGAEIVGNRQPLGTKGAHVQIG